MTDKRLVLFLSPVLLLALLLVVPLYAQTERTTTTPSNQTRLDAAKLRACQKVETSINRREEKMVASMDKHLGVFTKLQARVEARYTKVVEKGRTVPNYASLLSVANKAKADASAAIAAVKTKGTLNCTAENPKGQVTTFRESMQAAKSALHAYQLAIKNLNVAISSAVGEEKRSKPAGQ